MDKNDELKEEAKCLVERMEYSIRIGYPPEEILFKELAEFRKVEYDFL